MHETAGFLQTTISNSCLPQRNKTAVVWSVYWNNKHTSTKMTKHLARLGRSCAAAPGVRGAGPVSARRGWHRASAGPHDTASQEVPMIKIWPRPALLKSTYSKWNTLLWSTYSKWIDKINKTHIIKLSLLRALAPPPCLYLVKIWHRNWKLLPLPSSGSHSQEALI